MPRYKQICEKNRERRDEVVRNSVAITKSRERPFSFYERDLQNQKSKQDLAAEVGGTNQNCQFQGTRANPIPKSCSVLIFHQMQEEDAKKRAERITKNAELSY